MNLQAVIFDFDGVLADTEKLHLLAFQEVLGEQGVRLSAEDYFARYLGLDDYHVLLAIASDCALPPGDARVRSLLERKARRYADLIATAPLIFDGVERIVREWSRQVPLAIASGALRREIEGVLGRSRLLECFRAIVSADDVPRGKPAPDTFLLALDRLRGDSPAACVVIEDSLPGIAAARAAGMHVVGVATSHPTEGLREADLVVSSLTDLDLSMLDDLAGSG